MKYSGICVKFLFGLNSFQNLFGFIFQLDIENLFDKSDTRYEMYVTDTLSTDCDQAWNECADWEFQQV